MCWIVVQNGYDPSKITELGNRFLIGNGYAGVRGTLEEHNKEDYAAVNMAGIYDQHGDGWREPLNSPNPFFIRIAVNGEDCSVKHTPVSHHTQGLDFRHGVQFRETAFITKDQEVKISSKRFISLQQVHLLALEYTVQSSQDGTLALHWSIDTAVWDIHGPHYSRVEKRFGDVRLGVSAVTESGEKVALCGHLLPSFPARQSWDRNILTLYADIKKDQPYAFTMVAALYTTKDTADPEAAVWGTALPEFDTLLKEQEAAWESLWDHAQVEIEGDPDAQRALNYSLYHLLSIAPRHRQDLSITARGLSGQTYKGAVFWDTEMFMLDFYLACLPMAAKSAVNYRIQTLPGALKKAREYGLSGAFYAWESQEGGFDACSDYNVTDVFTGRPMRTYFRDKQIHISAAVAYGICKYMAWTGDEFLLSHGACEVLIQCARFYFSLLVKKVTSDVWELRDVIGPDEYHERVGNNAYTNEMARFTFQKAVWAANKLKALDPYAYKVLEQSLAFEKELTLFSKAAAQLKEQVPDPTTHLVSQFDGYFDLEDAPLTTVKSRLKDPKEYWGGAYGVASQTQIIKQADVMTMMFLFQDQYSKETIAANYDYYEPRTEHGSSLSACMYALTACLISRPEAAYPLFMKSAQADLIGGGKQWAGLVYIGGTHPAASGGAYMTLLRGFLGLSPENGQLTPHPCLPKHWKRVKINVWHNGQWHPIKVTA